MQEQQKHEAPRFFHIASWSMAIVGAFVFSGAVGLVAYNMAQNPISASQGTNPSCTNPSEQAVISNYPGPGNLINGTHDAYKPLNNSISGEVPNIPWRCSAVCIPGYDRAKTYNDPDNKKALDAYFAKMKIGNVPAHVVTTANDFNAEVKNITMSPELMIRTVILGSVDLVSPNTKTKKLVCDGSSNEYRDMSVANSENKDEAVTPVAKNPSLDQYKASQAAAELAPQPAAGKAAEGALKAGTSGGRGSGSTKKTDGSTKKDQQEGPSVVRRVGNVIIEIPRQLYDRFHAASEERRNQRITERISIDTRKLPLWQRGINWVTGTQVYKLPPIKNQRESENF